MVFQVFFFQDIKNCLKNLFPPVLNVSQRKNHTGCLETVPIVEKFVRRFKEAPCIIFQISSIRHIKFYKLVNFQMFKFFTVTISVSFR